MTPMPGLNQLLRRFRSMRRQALTLEWLTHVGWMVTLFSLTFVLAALSVAIAIPPSAVRVGLLVGLGAALAILLLWAIAKMTIWSPRNERLALVVEAKHPELKNRLIASLQLADRVRFNPERYSLELVDLTIRQAVAMSEAMDFAATLDRARAKRAARWAGIGLGIAVLLSASFPGLARRSWEAYSSPLTDYSPPISYSLSVAPGSVEAVKFDDFTVEAKVVGTDLPRDIQVHQRTAGGDWRAYGPLSAVTWQAASGDNPRGSRSFKHVFPQVKRDFEYYVVAGELTSPVYAVQAVDRPRVNSLRLEILPPRYTGLEAAVIDANDGAITAPVGSDVRLRIESNRDLQSAAMAFSDGHNLPLEIRGRSASIAFTIDRNTSYHLDLIDQTDRTNPHPIEYAVTAIRDRDPSVEIVWPGHNSDLDERMSVDLKIVARDDYGFSDLTLHTRWISGSRERAKRAFPIADGAEKSERIERAHFWDLSSWGLMPEDVIHYYVEVADNDAVSGPKTARSKTYMVRLPSLDEMMAEFEEEWDREIGTLDQIMAGEREMARRIEELRRDLAGDKEIDWEQQKDLRELSARASNLEQELDDIAENMEERVADAAQRKMMSVEMLQKMLEAQQLFQEVATEEMREAQRKLREALESMDPQDIEKALSEMDISQEEMLRRLERTIAYLKKLKAEQKVDAMIRRLEDMLGQQESLNQQAGESASDELPDLAPPQDRLKESFGKFADELASSEPELQEARMAPPPLVSEFCQSAQSCQAPQHMRETSENMKRSDKKKAQNSGSASSGAMSELLEKMKALQQEMNRDNQAETAAALRKALDNVLYVSDEQEDLMQRGEQLDPNSLSLREMAAEQEALRQATNRVADQMRELSKKSTCMSNSAGQSLQQAMDKMQSSAQCLSDRRGPQAGHSQHDALSGLNSVAGQLIEGMDKNDKQCQNSGQCENPGGGAMAKMETLSQQQGRLNQQMPGPGQTGPSMSEAERETLSRLKSEQEAVKRGVEELSSEIGDDENHLGRLDKLAEEMQKVVEDMERSDVSQQTRDRQQRIYARMLDFQHALQRQDYKDQRRARTAQNYRGASPDQLDPAGGLTDEEYQRLLTRYQEEGFPPEYEETIKAYFRALVEARGR
ncbi:MAG TPA: DUF4175 family protein [Acidobacteriota bacterium]|nr:DUF4175 family protein [Acidobacteriota bacterium]